VPLTVKAGEIEIKTYKFPRVFSLATMAPYADRSKTWAILLCVNIDAFSIPTGRHQNRKLIRVFYTSSLPAMTEPLEWTIDTTFVPVELVKKHWPFY
jgi:hypothetical protein